MRGWLAMFRTVIVVSQVDMVQRYVSQRNMFQANICRMCKHLFVVPMYKCMLAMKHQYHGKTEQHKLGPFDMTHMLGNKSRSWRRTGREVVRLRSMFTATLPCRSPHADYSQLSSWSTEQCMGRACTACFVNLM